MTQIIKTSLIAAILAISVGTANAYEPMITVLLLDASGSISKEDFGKAKLAALKFAGAYHKRSALYPKRRADWLSVNFFGEDTYYKGTPFFNCSDRNGMKKLMTATLLFPHPKRGGTAIYTAVGKALVETVSKDCKLPGHYIKNIIVVTDGKDNSKNKRMIQAVKKTFPNPMMNLFVIGVGKNADLSPFKNVADKTVRVESFDHVVAAMITAGHFVGRQ